MNQMVHRMPRATSLDIAIAVLAMLTLALLVLPWQAPAWQIPAPRVLLAMLSVLSYGLLCRMTWLRPAARSVALPAHDIGDEAKAVTLVVHASQTGTAQQLALRSAAQMQAAGHAVRLLALDEVGIADLQGCRRALFVIATTGEGDAPDNGQRFVERNLAQAADLATLEYRMLALGDSSYTHYCGFADQLAHWLQASGATAGHASIQVDREDAQALRAWHAQLRELAGAGSPVEPLTVPFEPWQLRTRRLANPDSAGRPCFHLELAPVDGPMAWQAGDIAQIRPRNPAARVHSFLGIMQLDGNANVDLQGVPMRLFDALQQCELPRLPACAGMDARALVAGLQVFAPRSYSIASLPSDGHLHLLVRQTVDARHHPGPASGWLTEHVGRGDTIDVRIRPNPRFRVPADDRPLILIGNGTGIAGLLGLLRQRIRDGHRRNWLLFGERNASKDFFHADLLQEWHAQGALQHLDAVFSRDQEERVYVQHRLAEHAQRLREWVGQGADIVVCGALDGMAPAVDAVLAQQLGSGVVDELRESGRYRRDVY